MSRRSTDRSRQSILGQLTFHMQVCYISLPKVEHRLYLQPTACKSSAAHCVAKRDEKKMINRSWISGGYTRLDLYRFKSILSLMRIHIRRNRHPCAQIKSRDHKPVPKRVSKFLLHKRKLNPWLFRTRVPLSFSKPYFPQRNSICYSGRTQHTRHVNDEDLGKY